MKISENELKIIILEEIDSILDERCQKGYKTHHKRKTKKMYGKTYRNCVKAEGLDEELEESADGIFKYFTTPDEEEDEARMLSLARGDDQRSFIMQRTDSSKKDDEERAQKLALKEVAEELEEDLKKWFDRKGAKGSKGGWVDCNTCRKDKKSGRKKCSACGRSTAKGGSKRKRYPACRPTPSACSKKGKWGKKSKAEKKRKKK